MVIRHDGAARRTADVDAAVLGVDEGLADIGVGELCIDSTSIDVVAVAMRATRRGLELIGETRRRVHPISGVVRAKSASKRVTNPFTSWASLSWAM